MLSPLQAGVKTVVLRVVTWIPHWRKSSRGSSQRVKWCVLSFGIVKGVILLDVLEHGQTMNSDNYQLSVLKCRPQLPKYMWEFFHKTLDFFGENLEFAWGFSIIFPSFHFLTSLKFPSSQLVSLKNPYELCNEMNIYIATVLLKNFCWNKFL